MATNYDEKYVKQVLNLLSTGPTQQDLDFLVEAFTRIGYYAEVAQTDADMAEAHRKHAEAAAYIEAKKSGEKVSDSTAQAIAVVKVWDQKQKEIELRGKAKKLSNLQDAVREAINGVKFLGRMAGGITDVLP